MSIRTRTMSGGGWGGGGLEGRGDGGGVAGVISFVFDMPHRNIETFAIQTLATTKRQARMPQKPNRHAVGARGPRLSRLVAGAHLSMRHC